MRPIVLATASKYKLGLFQKLGLPFQNAAPRFRENIRQGVVPETLAAELAEGKAFSLSEDYPNSLIIGTDQVLALGKEIFTKPMTTARAVAQLLTLCGKTHDLHSAFTLWQPATNQKVTRVVTARLTFRDHLGPAFLRRLVEEDRSQDCVGGYKYESKGIFLMKKIETSDTNAIVGLPLIALIQELQKLGYFSDRFE